ncbi:MAG: hypothetical protein Kow00123_28010 [Anaerolineales bacterium]
MAAEQSEKTYAESLPLTKADEDLLEYFKNLERTSLDAFEGAARQLISLITTLLGLFFGVLAFKDAPTYLACLSVRITAALTVVCYVVALFCALAVVVPRRFEIPASDLSAMKAILRTLFRRKGRALRWAQVAFALGTGLLIAVILQLLFRG